jgi:hypothetical protein
MSCPIARVRQQGANPMGLHHRYYGDAADPRPRLKVRPRTPSPYHEIQKRIGMMLREQYEPPKELPHRLLVLLIKADKQEGDKLRYEAAS